MEHDQSLESAAAQAVRLLGGPVKAADRLGVERYQTVQSWVKNQVPAIYCPQIVGLLHGALREWDLRPDDWHRYWPALVGKKGAPPIPEPTDEKAV